MTAAVVELEEVACLDGSSSSQKKKIIPQNHYWCFYLSLQNNLLLLYRISKIGRKIAVMILTYLWYCTCGARKRRGVQLSTNVRSGPTGRNEREREEEREREMMQQRGKCGIQNGSHLFVVDPLSAFRETESVRDHFHLVFADVRYRQQ